MEADYRDETIKSFAENILRLGNECRTLAEENARLKAEVERLRKAGDKMAKILDAHERVYNGCPSVEADSWWIARDGGCP